MVELYAFKLMPCQPEWTRSNSWLGTKPDLQHRTLRKPTHLCIMSLVSLDAWAVGLSMTLTKCYKKRVNFITCMVGVCRHN